MKFSTIFILTIMFFSISFIGCNKAEKPNYNYTNFQEQKTNKKEVKKVKKSKEIQNDDENIEYSFWFVVWEIKGEGTKVNTFIAQPHEGFSMKEFKKEYGENTFLVNLVEVSYATYKIDSE